jgi:hypothetical protein
MDLDEARELWGRARKRESPRARCPHCSIPHHGQNVLVCVCVQCVCVRVCVCVCVCVCPPCAHAHHQTSRQLPLAEVNNLKMSALKWLKSRPEYGFDWLICSKFARQRFIMAELGAEARVPPSRLPTLFNPAP